MKEIDLSYYDLPLGNPSNWRERSRPDMSREPMLEDIIKRVEAKENVFVKFLDGHDKRSGAIAIVKKIDGEPMKYDDYRDRESVYAVHSKSDYTFHLKWDDRKNTTKVRINYNRNFVYLPDYDGPTVWYMFDPKEFAEKYATPVIDRLGNELAVNDTVVYINSRYASGAELDFGVIREIKQVGGRKSYHGSRYIKETVIIESIAIDENAEPMKSKIKQSERSIIKINDIDLFDEAFVRKLIQ